MFAFVLSAAFASSASAQFTVDLSSRTPPLNLPLLDCVGSGHGSLATRADYQQHLAAVQRDINFKHIRGHGLFNDDMSTLLGGSPNLYNLFRAFDFYLSVGIRPIFELSFMPEALASDPSKTIMHYKGGTSPPKDPKAWAALVAGVVQGCVDRYGVEEVRSWRFEVWKCVCCKSRFISLCFTRSPPTLHPTPLMRAWQRAQWVRVLVPRVKKLPRRVL